MARFRSAQVTSQVETYLYPAVFQTATTIAPCRSPLESPRQRYTETRKPLRGTWSPARRIKSTRRHELYTSHMKIRSEHQEGAMRRVSVSATWQAHCEHAHSRLDRKGQRASAGACSAFSAATKTCVPSTSCANCARRSISEAHC